MSHHLLPEVKDNLVKNQEYLIAKRDYKTCLDIKFKKYIDNHQKFDEYVIRKAKDSICQGYADKLKSAILEGGLEYDNFLK